MSEAPLISSFVIRFIQETSPEPPRVNYRGMIRHVQSDQEVSFTRWGDALTFIQQFVPLQDNLNANEISSQEDKANPS
jgi:hypothetical protein